MRTAPLPTYRIPLEVGVPEILADELTRRLFYMSETIVDFSLVHSEDGIRAVDLTVEWPIDPEALARKLRFVVANDVIGQRPIEPNVIWRSTADRKPHDIFDELLTKGIVSEAGEGQVAVGEPIISLMGYLDATVRALSVAEFGAQEFRYPTVIPTTVIRRGEYLKSFPQLLMFVSRLHSDVDVYRGFLNHLAGGGDLIEGLRSHCDNFDYCLPPTMCFHTYHQLADRPLPSRSLVVTSTGKSFRFESRYRRSLERLWDFTIREIVFLGPLEFVLKSRKRLMERTFELVEGLGMGGRCQVANDPFFVNIGTAERVTSQQLLELKYELRSPLDASRDVAVGSFNFHERFFANSFGIEPSDGSGAVYTACAGFGLERLAYAFLCQHGLDLGRWPHEVRRAVEGKPGAARS